MCFFVITSKPATLFSSNCRLGVSTSLIGVEQRVLSSISRAVITSPARYVIIARVPRSVTVRGGSRIVSAVHVMRTRAEQVDSSVGSSDRPEFELMSSVCNLVMQLISVIPRRRLWDMSNSSRCRSWLMERGRRSS